MSSDSEEMSELKALVFLAPGAEDMETVITTDMLRRAGIHVTIGGVEGDAPVTCSNKVVIVPDASLESVADHTFDAVIIPGGAKERKPVLKIH